MGAIADSTDAAWTVWKVVYAAEVYGYIDIVVSETQVAVFTDEEAAWLWRDYYLPAQFPLSSDPWEVYEVRYCVDPDIMAAGG